MSIGNLKDSGNQGNNFPWQLKMLQGLQAIVDGNCCEQIIPLIDSIDLKLSSQRITPTIIYSTGDSPTGIITDILSISFASVGTADALVSFDGGGTYVAITTGTTINMDAGTLNNYYLGNTFYYDTNTNTGAALYITYNS
jgi:hypothetical protein